ncbi:MAG: hypothetical protein HZB43_03450, partial [candidate division Zixibacteria bacterium]|nr:hypothetical protein [candidate division Zixibacteria bacterium]
MSRTTTVRAMRCYATAIMTLGICLLVCCPIIGAGSCNEDVPLDSWIYDAVFELSAQGEFAAILLHTKPYTRGEIADGLSSLLSHTDRLTESQRIWTERLKQEFAEELAADSSGADRGREYVRLGGGPTARTDQYQHAYVKNRVGFDAVGSFGVGRDFAMRTRVRFDSDGRSDTQFHGEYWKQKFTAWVEQAVMTWHRGRFHLAFGREYWHWGRSPIDVLLVSDHSPPFDGFRASY